MVVFDKHDNLTIKKEVTISGMNRKKNTFQRFLKITLIAIMLTVFMKKEFLQLLMADCKICSSL